MPPSQYLSLRPRVGPGVSLLPPPTPRQDPTGRCCVYISGTQLTMPSWREPDLIFHFQPSLCSATEHCSRALVFQQGAACLIKGRVFTSGAQASTRTCAGGSGRVKLPSLGSSLRPGHHDTVCSQRFRAVWTYKTLYSGSWSLSLLCFA